MENEIKKLKLCTINSDGTVTLLDFDINRYKIINDECYIIIDGDSNVSAKKITAAEYAEIRNKIDGVNENQLKLDFGE